MTIHTDPKSESQTLDIFFKKVKNMGFIERVFSWKPFRTLSFEAYEQYQNLTRIRTEQNALKQELTKLQQELKNSTTEAIELQGKIEQKQIHLEERKTDIVRMQENQKQLQDKCSFEKEQHAIAKEKANFQLKNIEKLEKELSNLKVIGHKDEENLRSKQLEITTLKGELQQTQEHLEDKSSRVNVLEEKLNHHEQRLLEVVAEKAALTGQVEQLQKTLQNKEMERGQASTSAEKNQQRVQELEEEKASLKGETAQLQTLLQKREKEVGQTSTIAEKNQGRIHELEKEKSLLGQQLTTLRQHFNQANEKLVQHEERIEDRQRQFDHRVSQLNTLKEQLDEEKQRIRTEREEEIRRELEAMKVIWQTHEEAVEKRIHDICNRYNIQYVDREKVPFRGKPDNTLRIANEYLIFDAKAPISEELKTFGAYVRKSAEQLKKYASQEDVKKDLFLVVPNNTSTHIKESFLNMVDYRVFVVTLDALEPIILSLLKIEEYEFAEQLSPEEREQIGRVIGKFAHATKRKIQMDSYLNNHFLTILEQCDQLPDGLLEEAKVYEKSDKLNPPMERRVKTISMKETHKSVKKLNANAQAENIPVGAALSTIDQIPVEDHDTLIQDTVKN